MRLASAVHWDHWAAAMGSGPVPLSGGHGSTSADWPLRPARSLVNVKEAATVETNMVYLVSSATEFVQDDMVASVRSGLLLVRQSAHVHDIKAQTIRSIPQTQLFAHSENTVAFA